MCIRDRVRRSDAAHEREHSIEVQLPFLQSLLGGGFTLVPLVVGRAGAEAVAPVLDTLQVLRHETGCWLEITTLLIPGLNDGGDEIDAMTRWIADRLGPDVPLHFTAFHPDYKLVDVPPTPPATLTRARAIALGNGLHYVYTGNVHDVAGGTTSCLSLIHI